MPDYPTRDGAGNIIVAGYQVDQSALDPNVVTDDYPTRDGNGAIIIPDRGIVPKSPPVRADTSGRVIVSSYPTKDGLGNDIITHGTGGGSGPVGPSAFVLPPPSFGSANLAGWWDVAKTYKDQNGVARAAVEYDAIGFDTVSYLEDLSGSGASFLQGDKALQPLRGPSGGPVFSATDSYMDCMRRSLFAGASVATIYAMIRPIAGAAKRTLLYISEATSSVTATALAVASGGTGYAVDDYITFTGGTGTQGFAKVTAVSSGVVTAANLLSGGSYSVAPSNPVAQGSTGGSGTGATFNLTFPVGGGGSSFDRFSTYFSSGSTTRKAFVSSSPLDGTLVNSTAATTSLGAPNNLALTDTTTFHRVGFEVDFSGASQVSYFMDGVADGVQACAVGALNTPDSVMVRLGNNSALNAAGLYELIRMVAISEIPDSSRRALINTYLTTGV